MPFTLNAKREARSTAAKCGKEVPGYDARTRRWRHLDTCQYLTILIADVPRVKCPEYGVVTTSVSWAEPGSGFTAMFEALPPRLPGGHRERIDGHVAGVHQRHPGGCTRR